MVPSDPCPTRETLTEEKFSANFFNQSYAGTRELSPYLACAKLVF